MIIILQLITHVLAEIAANDDIQFTYLQTQYMARMASKDSPPHFKRKCNKLFEKQEPYTPAYLKIRSAPNKDIKVGKCDFYLHFNNLMYSFGIDPDKEKLVGVVEDDSERQAENESLMKLLLIM